MSTYPDVQRLIDTIPAFASDVRDLLPADWQNQISACSARASRWQLLEGASVTSREAAFLESAPPCVGVVTGEVIAEELPWLNALYKHEFLKLANAVGEGQYEVSSDVRSGVNINATPMGARYEWHVDSNPITGLLFATSHARKDGGQLIFRPDPIARPFESWELKVSPSAGTLLLFDAREAAHVVTQVQTGLRLSVPMNYYFIGRQDRPEDLDAYLYS